MYVHATHTDQLLMVHSSYRTCCLLILYITGCLLILYISTSCHYGCNASVADAYQCSITIHSSQPSFIQVQQVTETHTNEKYVHICVLIPKPGTIQVHVCTVAIILVNEHPIVTKSTIIKGVATLKLEPQLHKSELGVLQSMVRV